MSWRVCAFASNKGGVGKTTSVVNVATSIAAKKKRVLLVDWDSQGNLTTIFFQDEPPERGVYDAAVDAVSPNDVVHELGPNLWILPATAKLAKMEFELSAKPMGREVVLKRLLGKATGFDYILVDCPPSLGMMTVNAMAAVERLFIPVSPERWALDAVDTMIEISTNAKNISNADLTVGGFFLTKHEPRGVMDQKTHKLLRERHGKNHKIFRTFIRKNVDLTKASDAGQNIFDYAPSSAGAEDYRKLADEIMKVQ